jgi:hypothetical protein
MKPLPFVSILFHFLYKMKGYFASRKLLLLLNLLRKLGNLSVEMVRVNIQGCQQCYFPSSATLTSYKNSQVPGGNNE